MSQDARSSNTRNGNPALNKRRRGFMLVELVFVLGLIAVAAVVAMQLYLEMTRDHARMLQQREAQQRFDLALRPLRTDVWNAIGASIDEAGVLHLTGAAGKDVQWYAGDQLKRVADSQPREWNQLGAQLSFAIHGSAVVLHEEQSQTDPTGGDITMPMVAGGLKGQTP